MYVNCFFFYRSRSPVQGIAIAKGRTTFDRRRPMSPATRWPAHVRVNHPDHVRLWQNTDHSRVGENNRVGRLYGVAVDLTAAGSVPQNGTDRIRYSLDSKCGRFLMSNIKVYMYSMKIEDKASTGQRIVVEALSMVFTAVWRIQIRLMHRILALCCILQHTNTL